MYWGTPLEGSSVLENFQEVELIECVRQQDDLPFFNQLMKIRENGITDETVKFLAANHNPEIFDGPIITATRSLMDKLNINYMLKTIVDSETNSSKLKEASYFRRSIEKYFMQFELSDPYTMINILIDSVDIDDISRSSDSEIINNDLNFRQGKIYDYNQFKIMKDYYYKSTKDSNIFSITQDKFEEFFYLGDVKEYGLLDCSSLDIENAMSLIVDEEMSIANESDFCKESNTSSMKELKKIYNISQYTNKSKYLVKCILNLDTKDSRSEISFDYEVNSKRISNIDKSFQ
jgi:hypothetical protein